MSTITREQAKDLRNAFQCWQQDYEPAEDKEQYDMFGLGVIAMDALLASLEAEPVADVVAWSHPAEERTCDIRWRRFDVTPGLLYTAPPAPVSVPAGYRLQPISEYDAMCAAMLPGAEPVTTAYKLPELTDAQCLEFLAVAFRHARIKGDIEFDDIRLGLKMAIGAAPQQEIKP